MTMEQLEYFLAAAEQDTFFNAAEMMHISQSSLSKQILKLEKELGITLLDRSHRKAELTPAGRLFYQDAEKLTEQYRQMLINVRSFRQDIRIGTLPILAQYDLTLPLKEFGKLHPELHLHISEVEEQELISGLENQRFDLVICRSSLISDRQIQSFPIASDRLMVILPLTHPLAVSFGTQKGKKTRPHGIPLSLLASESFILMNQYTSIYSLCIRLFQDAGIQPEILRTARPESIINAVSVGEGISLLPEKTWQMFAEKDLTALPLEPCQELTIVLARNKKSPRIPAFQELLDHLNR